MPLHIHALNSPHNSRRCDTPRNSIRREISGTHCDTEPSGCLCKLTPPGRSSELRAPQLQGQGQGQQDPGISCIQLVPPTPPATPTLHCASLHMPPGRLQGRQRRADAHPCRQGQGSCTEAWLPHLGPAAVATRASSPYGQQVLD